MYTSWYTGGGEDSFYSELMKNICFRQLNKENSIVSQFQQLPSGTQRVAQSTRSPFIQRGNFKRYRSVPQRFLRQPSSPGFGKIRCFSCGGPHRKSECRRSK